MMRSTICLSVCLLTTFTLSAQQLNIIPQPAEIKLTKGNFSLSKSTVIVVKNGVDDNAADFFNDYLKQGFGFKLKKTKAAQSNFIQLTTLQTLVPGKEGAYSLTVTTKNIIIQGQTASGTFCGMQTLIQLLPVKGQVSKFLIPNVSINDYPRFAYRGMHLDVSRHFMPVSFIKRYIDYIALHKMNYFHWHLTDDQGWRIEIKKYPKLVSVGGWRNGTIIGRYPGTGNDNKKYGGFYTQEQIKEVVAYAQKRYITVLPEIELPGHASAAIAAYPELSCFPNEPTIKYFNKQCTWSGDSTGKQVQQTWGVFDDVFCAGKENTFKVLQDIMDEVLTLFPSKMIHVGGDECPKENWKRCPNCQKRMKDNGLKDEHELQSYFIQRMEKYLNGKGRTLIGWDEILEGGLAPNALVMSWRGEEGGIAAAKENHDVVMTPGGWVYLDHSQSQNEDSVTIGGYTSVEKTYSYEPVPASLDAEQAKHILGAQGNVWTEYMKNTRKVEYMIFPRMSALSEVLWSPKEKRDWKDFEKRLQTQFKRYNLWKTNYSKAYFDLKASISPTSDYSGISWSIANKFDLSFTSFFEKIYSSAPRRDTVPVYDKKDISKIIRYDIDTSHTWLKQMVYGSDKNPENIIINRSGIFVVKSCKVSQAPGSYHLLQEHNSELSLEQNFYFNKATGKKITLTNEPSKNYPGDGAFTLVNGVQNEKGLARSREFLGWTGDDLEAIIDLGNSQTISNAVIHSLSSGGSWVYPPKYAEVFISSDGQTFTSAGKSEKYESSTGTNGVVKISFASVSARYIKVVVKNLGIIPVGNRGAGNKAWLFVDEIEVQ